MARTKRAAAKIKRERMIAEAERILDTPFPTPAIPASEWDALRVKYLRRRGVRIKRKK